MDRCCGAHPLLLLILGATPHAQPWLAAAASLKALPLRICQISPVDGHAGNTPSGSGGSTYQQTSAGCVTFADAAGQWQRVREVSEAGAVLVRPDGHVAWRSRGAGGVEHCTQQLRTFIERVMSL